MRSLILVAAGVLVSSSTRADPASVAAVDKLVRANLVASYTSHTALAATATADLVFEPAVDDNRSPWWDDKCGDKFCNDEVMLFGGWIMLDMKLAPFKPTIVVDDAAHVAWFTADLKLTGRLGTGDTVVVKGAWPLRVTGIVVDDHGWKVAAEKFSMITPDAKLVARADWVPNYGTLTDKLAIEFAAWFPGHLADHQSARATAATGTSVTDVGRDQASIAKLVRAWDHLALVPEWADVTVLGGGKVAWARTTVGLPAQGGVKLMTVGIIAVPEAGGWRWVSLSWSPEVQPDDATH